MILGNPLEDGGTLLDGAVVTDGKKFGPKSIEFRSIVPHLNQPFGECKLGLERIRASIRSDLIHSLMILLRKTKLTKSRHADSLRRDAVCMVDIFSLGKRRLSDHDTAW